MFVLACQLTVPCGAQDPAASRHFVVGDRVEVKFRHEHGAIDGHAYDWYPAEIIQVRILGSNHRFDSISTRFEQWIRLDSM